MGLLDLIDLVVAWAYEFLQVDGRNRDGGLRDAHFCLQFLNDLLTDCDYLFEHVDLLHCSDDR